jgi:hypothetical protein
MRTLLLLFAFLVSTTASAVEPSTVSILLADGRAVDLTPSLLAQLPKQTASGTAHGKTASYEGYDLRSVLAVAGVSPVESLRGKQLGTHLTVTAADGYKVVFSLAELDRTLGNTLVLLADHENGQALPESDGRWRLVVPGDERPARWVRQVISIRVSE